MKKTLLFIFLSACLSLSAQEVTTLPDLFEFSEPLKVNGLSKLSKSASAKMSSRLNNPMNIEIRKVTFKNMASLATAKKFDALSPGYLTIKIPKRKKKKGFIRVIAVPKQIESYENGGYLYVAELIKNKNLKGTLIINHKNGQNYGSMTFGKRVFTIESNGVSDDYLIEINNKKLDNEAACGTDLIPKIKKDNASTKKVEGLNLSAMSNSSRNVKVLVLFTDNANRVSNPQQLASTLMAETNSVLRNSKINSNRLYFSLVGTQRVNFNDRRGVEDVFRDGRNNAQIRQLRAQFHADLVVLLTDGNFNISGGTVFGVSSLNEYGDAADGYFAIVEADAGGYTFAHEIAHNLGARHNTDNRTHAGTGGNRLPNNLSETAKGHTWYKRNCFFCQKLYRKSVLSTRGTRGLRKAFFSNPDVKAESKARGNTGTSTRNNFRQLVNAASVVAAYDPFQELIVSINGPSFVRVGRRYTLSANVRNCQSITYRWEKSYNGFSYFNAGSASSITDIAVPYNGSQVYYRLRGTCSDGQVKTSFRTVYIEGIDGGNPMRQSAIDENVDASDIEPESTKDFADMVLYPNPANNELFILTDFSKESKIEVKIINILKGGKSKKLYSGKAFMGPGELRLDITNFDQGLYQLEMYQNGSIILSKRFLISR